MRRRAFLALLGSAAAVPALLSPRAARAQQPAMPLIGFLSSRSPVDSTLVIAAFQRGIAGHGFVDGTNVKIEYRWALGQYDRLPVLAAELVRLRVSVLVTTGGEPSALAAKAATSTIPIVFSVGTDPIKAGLVASYGRPGGNITGINNVTRALEAKRIGLLREVVPRAKIIGLLVNPKFPTTDAQVADAQEAVRGPGLELAILRAGADQEIDAAFEIVVQRRIPALVVGADPFFDTRRDKLVALAAHYAVPTMFQFREYAMAGGLMSYGIDLLDVYRQIGNYTGQILKGAKPADLPVLEPTKFQFVINLRTAKALGVSISDNLLSLADEAIE
jgi:putative ABC transport system substrate-binding protein